MPHIRGVERWLIADMDAEITGEHAFNYDWQLPGVICQPAVYTKSNRASLFLPLSSPALPCTFYFQHGRALRLTWRSCASHYSAILLASQAAPSYRDPFQLLRPPRTQVPQRCCCPTMSVTTIHRRPDSWIGGEVISLIPSYRTTRPACPLLSEDGASLV